MENISSKNNLTIKKIRSLSIKKYREQFDMFILEGEKVVLEAIKLNKSLEYICIREKNIKQYEELISKFTNKILLLTDDVFDTISSTMSPQSILAVVKYTPQNIDQHTFSKFIVLDHLQDPGNMGTIIRSGIASGFSDFVAINSVDAFSDKAIRSSSGTILYANVFNIDEKQFENLVRCNKINLVIAEANKTSIFDKNLILPSTFGLVIGNEGNGISDWIKSFKHISVSIPMDKKVESLNAGVSASVLMFILNNRS